nr:MAG TPA: hypothetical protein [Caudoviricetes sp.]
MNILKLLISGGIFTLVAYVVAYVSKCYVALLIVSNPELSDQKANSITKMMSRNVSIRFHNDKSNDI